MLYLPDCEACIGSAMGLVPIPHGESVYDSNAVFGLSDGESTCTWENEECPERCRTEHDAPTTNRYLGGVWECPETGQAYNRCDLCDDLALCPSGYRQHREEQTRVNAPSTCRTCNTQNTYMDELTEEFVCKCGADRLKLARKPVTLCAA